jgi:hypothetical protein
VETDSRAPAAILVAARDEEARIGGTVRALREQFPNVIVIVADDGSRDRTCERARAAGATVLCLARRGKGEALSAAERAASPGALVLADADLDGSLVALAASTRDLAIAVFSRRAGGGFGLVKSFARAAIRLTTRFEAREPLCGQRYLTARARAVCFPVARGFGCELRMTIDALRAGLEVEEIELDLEHRATGRDIAGFAHRGRQLVDALLALGPLAVSFRGLRLPVTGWAVPLAAPRGERLAVAAVGSCGLADDLWSGPERGWGAHLRAGSTTGTLKLVIIPVVGALATRSLVGGLLVGLAANALNQLDTRPGRALKAFLAASAALGDGRWQRIRGAVLLLPYDLRERTMLGDAGSNALGAVVGLSLVRRLPGRARWAAVAALAGLNLLGERRSLGTLIEATPGLRRVDALGRKPW